MTFVVERPPHSVECGDAVSALACWRDDATLWVVDGADRRVLPVRQTMRLFACDCAYRVVDLTGEREARAALSAARRVAIGQERHRAAMAASRARLVMPRTPIGQEAAAAVLAACMDARDDPTARARAAAEHAAFAVAMADHIGAADCWTAERAWQERRLRQLLRAPLPPA